MQIDGITAHADAIVKSGLPSVKSCSRTVNFALDSSAFAHVIRFCHAVVRPRGFGGRRKKRIPFFIAVRSFRLQPVKETFRELFRKAAVLVLPDIVERVSEKIIVLRPV